LKSVNSPEVQLRHTLFLFSFRSVTGGLRRPSPLAYAEGQAAVFAVNAALMTCQWQRCAWTVPCTPHWCRTRGWTSRKYRFPSFRNYPTCSPTQPNRFRVAYSTNRRSRQRRV